MVDIEALAKHNDAIILTIGAQMFDPSVKGWETRKQRHIHTGDEYDSYINVRVDVDEQERLGRRIDQDTVDWWAKQTPEAQHDAFAEEDRASLRDALLALKLLADSCKRVWSKGPLYDFAILEHAFEQTKIPVPWKFWNVRDARTVFSLTPQIANRTNGHLAIEDCRNQILMLQDSFELLGVQQLK
jgi:exodeoxyribonuclease VIII